MRSSLSTLCTLQAQASSNLHPNRSAVVNLKQMSGRNGVFPIEVFELVIDFVAEGTRDTLFIEKAERSPRRATLLACALTSRDWLPRTRHHWYHIITLYNALEVSQFAVFLRAFPAAANYVERINTFFYPGSHQSYLVIVQLAPLLPNVRTLTFSRFPWQNAHRSLFVAAKMFTSVTTLNLSGIGFGSSREYTQFVTAFAALRCLKSDDIHTRVPGHYVLPATAKKRTLPLVEMDLGPPLCDFDLLSTLYLTSSNATLRRFGIYFREGDLPRLDVLGNFLLGCVSLRSLRISTEMITLRPGDILTMDLSQARSLETLDLTINSLDTQYPLLLQLLSTCRSPSLRSIDVPMWFRGVGIDPLPLLEDIDWAQLDTLVSDEERFPALQLFRLDVFHTCTSVPKTFFRNRLPQLAKRGILFTAYLDLKGKEDDKGKQRAT